MGSMEDESVQALVLHGAKDLRIVCLSINEVASTDKTRKKEHPQTSARWISTGICESDWSLWFRLALLQTMAENGKLSY